MLPSSGLFLSRPKLWSHELSNQKSQTYAKMAQTATKNSTQAFQPTPVRSAILSILLMVPRNRTPVFSKESLICEASVLESRISSPMATVRVLSCDTFCESSVVAVTSFWDSNSSRTDVEYWPLELGVAGRNPDGVLDPFMPP